MGTDVEKMWKIKASSQKTNRSPFRKKKYHRKSTSCDQKKILLVRFCNVIFLKKPEVCLGFWCAAGVTLSDWFVSCILSRFAKSLICKLKIPSLVLQQLSSHICLAKLTLSCCFARAALARRPKGVKQQERINFAKQMCEESCWRTTQILQITLFDNVTDVNWVQVLIRTQCIITRQLFRRN